MKYEEIEAALFSKGLKRCSGPCETTDCYVRLKGFEMYGSPVYLIRVDGQDRRKCERVFGDVEDAVGNSFLFKSYKDSNHHAMIVDGR